MMPEYKDRSIARAQTAIASLAVIVDMCTLIGAFLSAFVMIFFVYQAEGILVALLFLPLLALVYIPGPAPTFAIVASILYFHFNILGLWLPVISYVFAVVSFSITLKRAKRGR